MSDSVRPCGQQPTRFCRPWDSPGKNTGMGCHFLIQIVYGYILIVWVAITKIKYTGLFKHWTFISHRPGGWGVQDEGTGCLNVWGESTSWLIDICLFILSPHGRKSERALWRLLFKGTNSKMSVPPIQHNPLPETPFPINIILGVRISTNQLWGEGHQHS